MKSEPKIMIAGIGGVGGYLAANLARSHKHVTFFARGKRKQSIEENGLKIMSECQGNFVALPERVVDNVNDLEQQDIIFICVKEYALKTVCESIKDVVGPNTIIVPVINGVGHEEQIREYLEEGTVVSSLIYIVSYTDVAYTVIQKGSYAHIHIGIMNATEQEQEMVEFVKSILDVANIECIVEQKILNEQWKKYIFNCAYNVITAFYNTDVQGICDNQQMKDDFVQLMDEAARVARASGIFVSNGFLSRQLYFLENSMEKDATSSLARDMEACRENELEMFSGYLIRKADELDVDVSLTKKIYNELNNR